MKSQPTENPTLTGASASPLKRRGLLLGAGAAGAAVLAARALPGAGGPPAEAMVAAAPLAAASDGYQVTAHVLRYYETTRV